MIGSALQFLVYLLRESAIWLQSILVLVSSACLKGGVSEFIRSREGIERISHITFPDWILHGLCHQHRPVLNMLHKKWRPLIAFL